MARLARIVVPGLPHHVTQRGNRRQDTFFGEADYRAYLDLLAEACGKTGVACWAYCLMPNHVHLILVPPERAPGADGLRAALGEAHRRYTRLINLRQGWRGHLWQERFHSFVMDEPHLMACARYVEQNPVKAGLVRRARDWRWSSARAHLAGRDDELCEVGPLLRRCTDWRGLLAEKTQDEELEVLRGHARTGRPLGDEAFLERLEAATGRELKPRRRGRPRKPGARPQK
jgi:putative transposase